MTAAPAPDSPAARSVGAALKAELNQLPVTERLLLLNWLAEHRTSQLRPAYRAWKATRPLQLRPVVPPMTVPGPPDTRYPPPGE